MCSDTRPFLAQPSSHEGHRATGIACHSASRALAEAQVAPPPPCAQPLTLMQLPRRHPAHQRHAQLPLLLSRLRSAATSAAAFLAAAHPAAAPSAATYLRQPSPQQPNAQLPSLAQLPRPRTPCLEHSRTPPPASRLSRLVNVTNQPLIGLHDQPTAGHQQICWLVSRPTN